MDTLTKREREILENLAKGLQNNEISRKLNITLSTVQNHIHKIYKKLGVRNRTEAAEKYWKRISP